MFDRRVYMSLIIMIVTVYAIRVIPFIIFRKEIKNKWIRSFLYYVPYVTLAVMTFPAILTATSSVWAGAVALAVGVIVSLISGDLFTVAISACVAVFLTELIV
ncbi:MAG: AzlD domain-containing protein [Lachnospiraceae bacterium]|nr:AzlD domain-containing protein [Lachnospiraceae bacterium]MBQ9605658.1 AzlD domain-containing protein [Lachnospiraceae bacterium]MBR1524108.1 AzlD domain-containing protein [Lachnospiraceae bacterium]